MNHLSDKPFQLVEAVVYETANKGILFWLLPSRLQGFLIKKEAKRKHSRYLKLRKIFKQSENE